MVVGSGIYYRRRWRRGREERTLQRVRLALLAWLGGLLAYLVYGWGWIPIGRWDNWPGWATTGLLVFGGALVLALLSGLGSGSIF